MRPINYCDNEDRVPLDGLTIQKILVLVLELLVLSFQYIFCTLMSIILGTKMQDIPSWTPSSDFHTKRNDIFF